MALRALARVDLGAIERNAARLAAVAAPAALCAVVKADGYGHGMAPAARAAQAGGAAWLAVATAEEARGLREAGVDGPVLVMGALSPEELEVALAARADVVAWREAFVAGLPPGTRVHVKLDTGMGRLGTRDPAEATRVAEAAVARRACARGRHDPLRDRRRRPRVHGRAAGALHALGRGAQAGPPGPARPRRQLGRDAARARRALRPRPLRHRRLRHGPVPARTPPRTASSPRSSLVSYVAEVKTARAGRRAPATAAASWPSAPTCVGTLPIGYGDGVRRALTNNADVLVGGRRVPLIGTVSMDNITVDLGDGGAAALGEEAVLIGRQGGERILAEEVARRLGTINYEVTCGISARVPRVYAA